MSTILQALRELEGKIAPEDAAAWTAEDRRWRWGLAAVAGVTILAAGAGAAFFFMRHDAPTPPVAQVVPQAPTAAPVAKAVPQVPTPPPAARAAPQRPAPPAATAAPPRPVAAPVPAPSPSPAEWRSRAAPSPPPAAPVRPAAPAPSVARPEPPLRSAGEPRIQVSGIRYSSSPAERAVTLEVDGGSPVTLHQGESMGELEVQLILPDGVYVRRGGHVWMLSADH